MTGALTGADPTSLADWLQQIRAVARLPDGEALEATDKLLWAVLAWRDAQGEDGDWEVHQLGADLDELEADVRRLTDACDRGAVRPFDADLLRTRVAHIGRGISPGVHGPRLERAKAAALDLARQLEVAQHREAITRASVQTLHSVASVDTVVAMVDRAILALRAAGQASPELEEAARKAKVRAAEYRATRKREEAQVARAGGSEAKAVRLEREAAEVRRQDWARAGLGDPA